ncbi:MAG: flagellar hook assembly protein FlgD [Myxococcota bacterium]|jgi:flagellar basal-body rod modification protein FlgD|nr:flagellar hook assembly protein FlgD [Myxococcota bacterium]
MQIDTTQPSAASGLGLAKPMGSSELGKEQFLQLLVAQLKNQDPLEPMTNAEFVAQLAQFSSVEQLVSVNQGINLLGMQQMGMSNAQAASFIGKEVEVKSDKLEVRSSDVELTAAFNLKADAESVTVNIRDSQGNIVRTYDLGAKTAGDISLKWDCMDGNGVKVPTGTYRVDIVATAENGNPVAWDSTVRGKVDGVSYEAGYPELTIGSIKAAVSDVIGVYEAETESAP